MRPGTRTETIGEPPANLGVDEVGARLACPGDLVASDVVDVMSARRTSFPIWPSSAFNALLYPVIVMAFKDGARSSGHLGPASASMSDESRG
jgi:hypothetical protein